MGFSPFDDVLFVVGPIFIGVIFILMVGTFIVALISNATQWKKNNDSPVLTVEAMVVAKRSDVHHHMNDLNDSMHHASSTTYYVTFEFESGDRMELKVQGTEYGMLIEQDRGKLTFQGTRYLEFRRI